MSSPNLFRTPVLSPVLTLGLCAGLLAACGDSKGNDEDTNTNTNTMSMSGVTLTMPTDSEPTDSGVSITNDTMPMPKLDLPPEEETEFIPPCSGDGACNLLDILFVIDNSGSMGEEQRNLAANFPYLIEKIRNLRDRNDELVNANVNIMVTTSDFGHPLCAGFNKPDYTPAKGAPINSACTERLERFNGFDGTSVPDACTNGCAPGAAAIPDGDFIRFDASTHNIIDPSGIGDPVANALSCIGPQGIDGCGMEAPLETMLQALDPNKTWNQGAQPFLRPGAVLAIVMVTDELDCSTLNYTHFDYGPGGDRTYWEDVPGMPGTKKDPTSAVCWNGGTDCVDANNDGVYESCMSANKNVLQPASRYIDYLQKALVEDRNKQVVMLGILGVPPVTARNEEPPFEPIAGGVFDLVYRDWLATDILPGDPKSAADKQYEFGIGPGCSNIATGQAVPPVRIKEVCESLNIADDPSTPTNEEKLRCCIESICDTDFSNAINCLAGILQNELIAPG